MRPWYLHLGSFLPLAGLVTACFEITGVTQLSFVFPMKRGASRDLLYEWGLSREPGAGPGR